MTSPPCHRSGSRPASRSARARRRPASAPPRSLLVSLLLPLALAGCGGGSGSGPEEPAQDRFDAKAAFELIEQQAAVGQRPAGSPQLRRLARRLEAELPNGRLEPVPSGFENVVGTLPGSAPAIVIGAHYDTEYHPKGFVGANDGAAGTASVVELSKALRRELAGRKHREIRFVLFDGEEEGPGCPNSRFEECALRGSRAYVAEHGDEVGGMILLDYIAGEGETIPRETNSDAGLWARLRAAAERVSAGQIFPAREQPPVLDDTTPFLEAGIPAV